MINLPDFSQEIWKDNYRAPGEQTVEDTWKRLSKAAASVEKEEIRDTVEQQFLSILTGFKFVPGGRIIANLGVDSRKATTLFNCFVHNPKDIGIKNIDSLSNIFDMLKAQAMTLKSEGGLGINSSWIRPRGMYIKGIGSRTPGVLKFMELWDKSSEVITMGSTFMLDEIRPEEKVKQRKGAQMLVLNVWHPEIEDFIKAKLTPYRLTKFNLSVGITDGFMLAVLHDEDWNLIYPDTEFKKYDSEWTGDIEEWKAKGYPIRIYKTLKARELWEAIMSSTYARNDPGVLFLDLANVLNPLYYAEVIFGSNPCGEILMSTGVCDLGSMNLAKYIIIKNNKVTFDFESYRNDVAIAVRFLDNINSISKTPLPEYDKAVRDKRRIGLGNMGLGSLHLMMLMRYGSEESIKFVRKLYKIKAESELLASAKLGQEKGSFPLFDKEKYFNSYWFKNLDIDKTIKASIIDIGYMRNSHHSMNAPTGNTGILAELVTGGIEPAFLLWYTRWSIVNEHAQRELREQGFIFPDALQGEWFETEHMKFVVKGKDQILKGSFNDIEYEIDRNRGLTKPTLIEDYGISFLKTLYSENEIKEFIANGSLATTNDLEVSAHIKVLEVIAHYTNMNNSKTVNVPNDYPYEDFKNLYLNAWKAGIKGITTYRAGTATAVLEASTQPTQTTQTTERSSPKRPKILPADIYSITVSGEKFVVAVGLLNDVPYEIFCGHMNGLNFKFKERKGKIEKIKRGHYKLEIGEDIEIDGFSEHFKEVEKTLFRMVSITMRHGIPIKFIVDQLQKSTTNLASLTAAAARVLKKYIKEGEKASGQTCPTCNSESLMYTEGCVTCTSCGWSKCN